MYGGEAGGRQYRGGGCSAAVKNTNTTHNYLAFTFLLSSSQTQGTPERLHRVAKGLATISVPSQFGKAHWIGWLLLHSAKKKNITRSISSLYHLSTTTQRCHLQHPVVTLSSPPIIIQLHLQVRILSQKQNKRYQVLDTCNDQNTDLKTIIGITGFFRWCSVFFISI